MSLVNGELLFWENAVGLGRVKGLNKEVFIKDEKTILFSLHLPNINLQSCVKFTLKNLMAFDATIFVILENYY